MSKKVVLTENAEAVAKARYFNEGEDWDKCTQRVASSVAVVEKDVKGWTEKFHEMLYDMDFLGGGRILRNSGRARGSMLNCFHLPCNDSIEEIGQFLKDSLCLWSSGGGVGVNLSNLRPKGDPILGKGGVSSGLVSFLKAADYVSETIESGGQRRAAGLASVDVSHPEIMDFIDAKMEHGIIAHFNISVMVNDSFLEAVEKDDWWDLKFKHKVYRRVKAREVWDKIINNMIKHAEPGILNTSNLFKNNSYYYDPVTGTNPCGEAVLSPYDSCDLGSLVLPNFITGNINTNWQKLEKTIKTAVRFLDNVLDVNKFDLKEIDIKAHNSRRIGLGVLGLADYLFAKELRYGSDKALNEIDKLMKFIRDAAYEASVELAVEKGAFPKFEPVAYGKASFVRKLPASLRFDIKEKGIRNVTCLSIAPTGTIALLPNCTGGIEPLTFRAYKRKDRVSERVYIHPKYKQLLMTGNKIPDWFVDMTDLTPKDHLETQAVIQKYVDGSVSKTINMPKGTTKEQVDKLILEYIHDVKGLTIYIDETREGQVYNKMSEEEVIEKIAMDSVSNSLSEEDIECNCQKAKDETTGEEVESCSVPNKEV